MSAGDLPLQRAFYIGGLQTVRGQYARLDGEGRVGESFLLGRGEVALGRMVGARPTVFYDIGWAGSREEFARRGRPLSGAGVGLSLLDGMIRFDVSRGIRPEQRWRVDFYLDARF
jgi:hemolysin activation/secretion protein